MATNTYVALDTVTVSGSSTTAVTFTSIPSTYTDLVIVANWGMSADDDFKLQVGSSGTIDTATNYSATNLRGNGTAAASGRQTGVTYIPFGLQNVTNPTTLTQNAIFHIMNYSNTTTFKTFLGRANDASTQTIAKVGLWRSTAAINILQIERVTAGRTFLSGSTFTLYGIAAQPVWAAKATGGTITNDVQYTYHTFTSSGTFTPNQALTCDYLVVAGGGGPGKPYPGFHRSGTGGSGGMRCTVDGTGGPGSLETALALTAQGYTVTIGAGGAAATSGGPGTSGNNSVFSTITSTGGGVGGNAGTPTGATVGTAGGSGGGGGSGDTGTYTGGAASPSGQGFAGGNGSNGESGNGGGAASAGGTNPTVSTGRATSISGSSVTYARGGNQTTSANGTANTGNGGNQTSSQYANSYTGGSGIVIVRYAN
jgi:hypothetical protein